MSEKDVNAVNMMREIRDTLSKEFEYISYEEQIKCIRERINPKRDTQI